MLKKQRNAIYTEILGAGLDPRYFEIVLHSETSDWLSESVTTQDGHMWFRFSQEKKEIDIYRCYFTYPQPGFKNDSGSRGSFSSVLKQFKDWLIKYAKDYVENEIEGVDLWSPVEVFKSITGESTTPSQDDTKFTPQEKEHIRQSTQRFRQLVIQNFKPTKEQQQHIDSQLDYLVNAVDRLSRRDWRGVALSTLISISINLAVDTEKGRLLFNLFAEAFNQIIKALPHIT